MGRSHESIGVQNFMFIGEKLIKKIPFNTDKFSNIHPLYLAATRLGFSDHRIRNVLESFLPADDISKGIEDLKEIRCRYFAAQEQRQKPWQEQEPPHHKKKHRH